MNWQDERDSKTHSRIRDIKHLLKDIKSILESKKDITRVELTTDKDELCRQVDIEKAKAETWKEAFELMASIRGASVSETGNPLPVVNKKERQNKKTALEAYQEGELYAIKILDSIKDENVEAEIGLQSVWLLSITEFLRKQVVEYIIGTLVRIVKENAIRTADWLLSQTEEVILKGFERLSDEDKSLIKNELKQYPRFAELLKKIEEKESQG